MRRITSREKFFTLNLRDDGGLIMQSTRGGIWGVPPNSRKVAVQIEGGQPQITCNLGANIYNVWLRRGPGMRDVQYVGSLHEVPIEETPIFSKWSFNAELSWSYPSAWPQPLHLSLPYALLPTNTPHIFYYRGVSEPLQLLDLRAGTTVATNDRMGNVNLDQWRDVKACIDGRGLLFVRPRDTLWYYDYALGYAKSIYMHCGWDYPAETYLAAGWGRALFKYRDGVVLRSFDRPKELLRIQPPSDQQFIAHAVVPGMERLLTANADHSVSLWDLSNGRELQSWNWNVGKPLGLAVAPGGLMAVVSGTNRHVVVWDLD